MILYDRKTGAPKEFADPADAQAAYQSGQFAPKKTQRIPIVTSDGTVGTVTGTQLGEATKNGARVASEGEYKHAENEAKYGGAAYGVAAHAAGWARSLSFGTSDALGSALGAREALEGIKEAHPIASATGEIAGAVVPVLLSGGAAAPLEAANIARIGVEGVEAARGVSALARAGEVANLAREGVAGAKAATTATRAAEGLSAAKGAVRAAGVLPRGVAAAGDVVERGVMDLMGGEAKNLAARVVQKGVALGARGAAEGAVYGAANEVSESALGDHDLTAERLLAAMGHGALYGAAGGALAGAGAEVGSAALKSVVGKLRPALENAADEQAWRALSPIKKFTKEVEARAGGVRAVGRTLREEGVIAARDTVEDIAPKISAAKERVGQRLGEIVDASGARVSSDHVIKAIDDVIAPIRGKAGHEGIVASLEDYQRSLFQHLGLIDEAGVATGKTEIAVGDLLKQRKALDALAYQEARSLDPKLRVAFLRDMRSGLEKLETAAIDDGASMLGAAQKGEYKALKTRYQHLSIAEKAAQDTAERMATNNMFSLGDKIAGAAGLAGGAFVGGPIGAAKGMALAAASKYVREHGNSTAAALLGKLADLSAIQQTTAVVERRTAEAVDGIVSKPVAPKLKPRVHPYRHAGENEREEVREEYEERVRRVKAAVAEPQRAGGLLAAMTTHAPKTGASLQSTIARATTFLASKIPTGHDDFSTLQPLLNKPRVSDAEAAKFMRYALAVDDPAQVLEDMAKKGTVSHEAVEAMKVVYPKLYDDVRQQVLGKLADTKNPLPYQRKVQLGILLDIPADRTMTPDFQKAMAASYAGPQGEQPQGAPAPPAPSGKPVSVGDIAGAYRTVTQQIESETPR